MEHTLLYEPQGKGKKEEKKMKISYWNKTKMDVIRFTNGHEKRNILYVKGREKKIVLKKS